MENLTHTILITGGTGLLGSQFVEHFLRKKWSTVTTSRNEAKIEALKKKFEGNSHLHIIRVDHEDEASTDTVINYLEEKNIMPQSLINNVINLRHQQVDPVTKMTKRAHWLGEFLMDVVVPYELSMRLAKHEKFQLKSIVNISSMYGVVARHPGLYKNPDMESPIQYGVAKAGLIHLTKELAVRLAFLGVRVNCVSYGGVEGRVDDEFKKRYAALSPTGMLAKDDITGAVDFLVSDGSSRMTGQNIIVDGGWTIW